MLKLVYGCLAFSAIALVIIFVSAANQGPPFRGMTKSMADAVSQGATILAADRNGAVTQSGNGRIAGFDRGSDERVWSTSFSRFEEGPANPYGAGSIDATASCAIECPSAIVELLGRYSARGAASPELAATLTDLAQGAEGLLAIPTRENAFVRAQLTDADVPQLLWVASGNATGVSVQNPSAVEVDSAARHAVAGAAKGSRGTLSRIERSGNRWKVSGRSILKTGLKNMCISPDGEWVGSVGTRIHRFAFDARDATVVGPEVATGTCTVDSAGITVPFTTATDATLQVTRFSATGRPLWSRKLGAQRLLSKGGSPYIVSQAANGDVTALDAVTGRVLLTRTVVGAPYVGRDGSVVIGDREGHPEWLIAGRASVN